MRYTHSCALPPLFGVSIPALFDLSFFVFVLPITSDLFHIIVPYFFKLFQGKQMPNFFLKHRALKFIFAYIKQIICYRSCFFSNALILSLKCLKIFCIAKATSIIIFRVCRVKFRQRDYQCIRTRCKAQKDFSACYCKQKTGVASFFAAHGILWIIFFAISNLRATKGRFVFFF